MRFKKHFFHDTSMLTVRKLGGGGGFCLYWIKISTRGFKTKNVLLKKSSKIILNFIKKISKNLQKKSWNTFHYKHTEKRKQIYN